MTTTNANDIPRATTIVTLATSLGVDPLDVRDAVYDVIDMNPATPYPAALLDLIKASFQSDDDGDDLMHEIDHEVGVCEDGDSECVWADDEDDDDA